MVLHFATDMQQVTCQKNRLRCSLASDRNRTAVLQLWGLTEYQAAERAVAFVCEPC